MTIIQIKYSTANTEPASGVLATGELAYSEVSKKLFIGNDFGTANVIGGQKYIDLLESNTSFASPSSIVIRDSQGSFFGNVITANSFVGNLVGNLDGNAATSSRLANNFTITLSGNANGDVSLNGSSNVTLNVTLVNTSVTSGSYGNTRFIPTFTVGADGRITGVTNVAIDFPDAADFSQDSYNQANASYNHANAAYQTANTAIYSNAHANASFNIANLALTTANSASSYANGSFAVANVGNTTAAAASSYANSAYQKANAAGSYANSAFLAANTGLLSFNQANSAFNTANTALNNSVNTSLLLVEIFANVVATETTIATAGSYANSAYRHANASFNTANTKFNSSGGTISGDVNVTGNLTVTGNVTYVATNQLNLGDAVITLNADLGQSALPTEDAGIEIERGRYQNASILWNETLDRWQFTDNVSTSNIGSAAAEVYANAAYDAANAAYAFAGQATIAVSGSALAANAAGSYANAAFLRANSAFSGTTGTHSNSAYAHANAAFAAANSATPQAVQSAFDKANSAFDAANNAFIAGGQIAGSYANSAYLQANAAFNRANSANNLINETRLHANGAFSEANNATLIGLAAFALANSIQFSQGTEIATYAWVNSNAAYNHANGAFVQANTANVQSVVSGIYANAAFALANTKFNNSGGTISGDVVVSGNLRVDGDRAQFFVSSISIEDNLIDIATDQTGAPSLNSGIRVIRGDESPVLLRWNESNDYWQFTNDGISYSNIGSYAAESYANSAFGVANTANAHSISAFSLANTVNAIAQAAYDTANNAGSSAILQAAFNTANSAGSYANGAFGAANSAGSFANSALGAATTADQRAVTAGVFANAAFEIANVSNEKAASGYRHANASFNWANSAYNAANSKLDLSGGTLTGPLTVQGGVTIVGGLLYANSSTVILADNIITLNAAIDQASAPAFNAGIEVDRGTSDNVAFIWNESDDHWQFTNDGTNYINVASEAAEFYANSAFSKGNAAASHATSAYDQANLSTTIVQSAFNKANTGNITAQAAFDRANSAYDLANGKSTFYFSSFPPGSANEGDRWIDADLGQEFIYVNDGDSLQWIELSAFVDQNLVDDNIYYVLGSDDAGSDLNTVQSIFGVAVNLAANTVYEFEASFALKKTGGTNSHSLGLGFAGSIGVNHILYHVTHTSSALNSPSTPTLIMINTVSNTTVSSNTNVDNHNVFLKGMISVGSAGSFVPQYRLSDAPGAAFSTLAGSYFKMEPVGSSNTNINVGSWS